MKRERWRTVFFLFILLIFTLFVRFFFLQPNAITIELAGDYYQKAMVGSQGIYKLQRFSLEEVYTMALSFSMLVFGNSEIAGAYLNIILQVLAIVCIYFAISFVANSQVSLLIAVVVSLIPFYSDKVYEVSSFNLLMLLYAVGFMILAIVCKGVAMFVFKKKAIEQENNNIPVDVREEQTGVITLDDIIGESGSSDVKEEAKEQKETPKEDKKEESENVPAGMKEIILDEEEKKKNVKFIENPLPVPKRREHKEMDFAVELRDDNDDYDIKDVSGMDFFDIE
ncbi:MAG: hypothetical protein IJO85_12495 [Lachnospiraceae bacterium]|nr:hypothetical protein [Lachnospiraceae bacterium]